MGWEWCKGRAREKEWGVGEDEGHGEGGKWGGCWVKDNREMGIQM